MTGLILLIILGSQLAILYRLRSLVGETPEPQLTESDLLRMPSHRPMWAEVPTDAELRIVQGADGDALYLAQPVGHREWRGQEYSDLKASRPL